MGLFSHHQTDGPATSTNPLSADHTTPSATGPSKQHLRRATRKRQLWAILSCVSLFLAFLFLLLLQLGSTHNKHGINSWYFLRLDLSDVVPSSVPNAVLINTIAQTLGLHDFYQVGLWGFCEGYEGVGVTFCSRPRTMYWFDPVSILRDELLAGASINLPANINSILSLIRLVSHWMFALFFTSTLLSPLLIPLAYLSLHTRWLALLAAILSTLNALFAIAASVLATAMFSIFRKTITGVAELNIGANTGKTLFGFMWVASIFALVAAVIQMALCCCCASRRDVKKGKKGHGKAGSGPKLPGSGAGAGPGASEGWDGAADADNDLEGQARGGEKHAVGARKKRFWQRR